MADVNRPEDAEALERWLSDRTQRLRLAWMSSIESEPVRWLWHHRIPIGSLTLLAGRQGLGKSTLVAELAARVSKGELRGDYHGNPAPALLITFEDHPATTLRPRLEAAGADLDRVALVHIEPHEDLANPLVTLPDDLGDLERRANEVDARFLIIDPVVASLPSSIDAHRDQDVRRALAPLGGLAERCGLAVLGLIHWNKSASTDALTRISGSTAFSAAARSVLAFGTRDRDGEADDGRRVLAHAKCNLCPTSRSMEYELEGVVLPRQDDVIETVRIKQLGECDVSPTQLLAGQDNAQISKTEEACVFLRDELADGRWHRKEEVIAAAQRERISRVTLQRAFNKSGAEFRRHGFPARAEWRLLPVSPTLFEDQSAQ